MKQAHYRLDQFRRARRDAPTPEGLEWVRTVLSPQLFDLFTRMLPFEQAHAIRVLDGLAAQGFDDPDLLCAALLHDVGKIKHPLRPWERALAVLVKEFFPAKFRSWGLAEPSGLTAGIVVAAQHAEWGAQIAAEAGASERTVWLIAHHDTDPAQLGGADVDLLKILQHVDAGN